MSHFDALLVKARFVGFTSLTLFCIVGFFTDAPVWMNVTGWLSVFCMLISIPGARPAYLVMSGVLFAAASVFAVVNHIHWTDVPRMLASNAFVVVLMYLLPFLNNLIVIGRYDRQIRRMLKANVSDFRRLYVRTSILAYILCLFIFLASIPAVYRTVKDLRIREQSEKFINVFASKVVLRTFSVATVWSPVEVFIVVAATMTGVPYLNMLPFLVGFSLFMLVVDWGLKWRWKRIPVRFAGSASGNIQLRTIIILLAMLFLFISLSQALSVWLAIDFFYALILMIVPLTLVWSVMIRRFCAFTTYNRLAWPRHLRSMQNFALLFLSIGFLNESLGRSEFIGILGTYLIAMADQPLLLFVTIQILSFLAALAGVHPLLTLSLLATIVQPLLAVLNPLSVAIVLLTASLANDSSGPANSTIALLSQANGENPYRISARNIGFALLYGWVGVVLGYVLL